MEFYTFVFDHFAKMPSYQQDYLQSLWQRCQVNGQVTGAVAVNFFKQSNVQVVSKLKLIPASANSRKSGTWLATEKTRS